MLTMPSSSVVACVFFCALALFVVSNGQSDCGDAFYLSNQEFAAFVTDINAQSFSSDKLKVVEMFTNTSIKGFTGSQVAAVLTCFSFSSDKVSAVKLIAPHILSLSCQDVANIISKTGFSSDKMTILKTLADLIIKADIMVNRSVIIDQFSFSSDKLEATQVLLNAKGRTCLWGSVTSRRVLFVIDVSGSMSSRFYINGGQYTRLGYVQSQLTEVLRNELSPDQSFNILTFSSSTTAWAPGLLPVTPGNIDQAASFAASLVAGGSTNTAGAFQAAFQQSNVEMIYLLSDGEPDSVPAAVAMLQVNEALPPQIPITAILIGDGGNTAETFMQQVATISGGLYRFIKH